MKIRSILILVVCLSFIIGFSNSVKAHVLKTSGSIGVVFHIDPDDSPVANQTSNFFFIITDKTSKFQANAGEYDISITENGSEIYSQHILSNSAAINQSTIGSSVVFPKKDVYIIKFSGKSIDGSFSSFSVSYDVRVAQDALGTTTPAFSPVIILAIPVFVVLIIAIVYLINKYIIFQKK